MTPHQGSCHCGAISLELRDSPPDAGSCNCSICRRIGALWHHCSPSLITVSGEGEGYVQGDKSITIWRCSTCGNVTHWTVLDDPTYDRMAVNLRMFEPDLWQDLPLRLIDGASF